MPSCKHFRVVILDDKPIVKITALHLYNNDTRVDQNATLSTGFTSNSAQLEYLKNTSPSSNNVFEINLTSIRPVNRFIRWTFAADTNVNCFQIGFGDLESNSLQKFKLQFSLDGLSWGEFDLFQKIIIIEDLDGLKEDALYALREFISNQVLRSSVTIKDKKGNNKSSHKIVKGQFSSLSATTKGETYEDNMNRSFIIAINESEEQTEKIIAYQNRRNAGIINRDEEQKAIHFIQKLVRNLKHYEVINPFATQIQLPNNVKNKRRLNEMFQSIIKQITILHQYQRETKDNFLVTEIEDIENAVEILFESILLKIDELDGSLRQFFEKLKKSFKDEHFNRFEAMEVTGLKKENDQRHRQLDGRRDSTARAGFEIF
jgi:hypothetical protein